MCGAVWCDAVRCGVVWCDAVWCGVVCYLTYRYVEKKIVRILIILL